MNHRPQPQIIAPAPSSEQTAAIVAALERFLRDTAPPLPASPPPGARSVWARAALLEATGHAPDEPVAWQRGARSSPSGPA